MKERFGKIDVKKSSLNENLNMLTDTSKKESLIRKSLSTSHTVKAKIEEKLDCLNFESKETPFDWNIKKFGKVESKYSLTWINIFNSWSQSQGFQSFITGKEIEDVSEKTITFTQNVSRLNFLNLGKST